MKTFTAQIPAVCFHIVSAHNLMKLKFTLTTCLLALGLVATLRAQDIKLNIPGQAAAPAPAAPAAPAPAPAAPTYTEAQVIETIGWYMGKNSQAESFEFTPGQIEIVLRGFSAALNGKPAPFEHKQIGAQVQAYVTAKQDAYIAKLKQKGLAETAAYLAEIKKTPSVKVTASGLCYEIIKPGEGPAPKLTDTVKAHYTGALISGKVFDSSIARGEPVEFPLDQVIPGWTEGLQLIAKGGKIRLYVPPQLAYGDDGRPGIPPASTLVFELEILDIKPTPPAPATPAPAGK
jgi:FKBP-type peptidyl-prolyl cis-trans isomerase